MSARYLKANLGAFHGMHSRYLLDVFVYNEQPSRNISTTEVFSLWFAKEINSGPSFVVSSMWVSEYTLEIYCNWTF